MWAMRIQATALSMLASKSFASRRHRPSQAPFDKLRMRGSFDHPSAWQQLESSGGVGAFDDFEGPLTERGHGVAQFIASIAAVGEDVAQPRMERTDRRQQVWRAIAILDIGGVNLHAARVALGAGCDSRCWDDMALAAFDLLTRQAAARPLGPPHSVVFTDWLSRIKSGIERPPWGWPLARPSRAGP